MNPPPRNVFLLVVGIVSQNPVKTLTSVLVPYEVLNLVIMMRSLGRSWRLVLFLGRALTSGQDLGSCRDVFCDLFDNGIGLLVFHLSSLVGSLIKLLLERLVLDVAIA